MISRMNTPPEGMSGVVTDIIFRAEVTLHFTPRPPALSTPCKFCHVTLRLSVTNVAGRFHGRAPSALIR